MRSPLGLLRWLSSKESTCQHRRLKRHGFDPWVGKIPWSRKWQPTPVFLRGKFHGQRSLAGYSPWDPKESAMTEHTHTEEGVRGTLVKSAAELEAQLPGAETTDSVQFSSVTQLCPHSLRLHEPQHASPPCPSTTAGVYPNPCPSNQ